MQQALLIIIVLAIIVLGFTAPKLAMWILMIGGSLGMLAANIYAKGFPEGLLLGLLMGGGYAFLIWFRFQKSFADTARARAWLEARETKLNTPTFCEQCGTELPYHRRPRSFSQLIWGGWTCPNCESELDNNGKRKRN